MSLELLQQAKAHIAEGSMAKAHTLLSDLIESGAEKGILTEAYFQLGVVFHAQGKVGSAIKAFKKTVELDSNHTDAAVSLSVLYNDIGHYEEAKKIFKQTGERVKNSSSKGLDDTHVQKKFSLKHYELAELYMSYNRADEALFEYNKAVALDRENLEARIKIAKVYAKKNFIAKAFEELKKLKNEHPSYLPARMALGVLYYGCGKVLEAQGEWQKVLAREPEHSTASMYLNLSKTAQETSL